MTATDFEETPTTDFEPEATSMRHHEDGVDGGNGLTLEYLGLDKPALCDRRWAITIDGTYDITQRFHIAMLNLPAIERLKAFAEEMFRQHYEPETIRQAQAMMAEGKLKQAATMLQLQLDRKYDRTGDGLWRKSVLDGPELRRSVVINNGRNSELEFIALASRVYVNVIGEGPVFKYHMSGGIEYLLSFLHGIERHLDYNRCRLESEWQD